MLAINKEEKKYGLRNLENDTPELNIEIISVLFANFDVNQITDKNNR